jgi:hypothetical protein
VNLRVLDGDQVAATGALESRLLMQDWTTVLRRVPVSEDEREQLVDHLAK